MTAGGDPDEAASRPTVRTDLTALSPWVTLAAHAVTAVPGGTTEVYHSLRQADYVSILAITPDGRIPVVRQFRPAVDDYSLELPGGLLERGEAPEDCARRELAEEAGLSVRDLHPLGTLLPDTGRLGNRLWGYFASADPIPGWEPEPGVSCRLVDRAGFLDDVRHARFGHALHVALVGIAVLRGLI